MLINTFDKCIRAHRKMIKLNKQELVDLTNRARDFLYSVKDSQEHNVIAFKEQCDGSVTTELLVGQKANGKSDLFPRGSDLNMHIWASG